MPPLIEKYSAGRLSLFFSFCFCPAIDFSFYFYFHSRAQYFLASFSFNGFAVFICLRPKINGARHICNGGGILLFYAGRSFIIIFAIRVFYFWPAIFLLPPPISSSASLRPEASAICLLFFLFLAAHSFLHFCVCLFWAANNSPFYFCRFSFYFGSFSITAKIKAAAHIIFGH